ncbi:DinB family protein [Ohtaekwangia kribbensis]|uniref:DinB family protein n=1 Tax=Ohtaekwangia kribbensis TaxID=688913 RepID=A0ABW3K6W3_9BACT
MNNVAEPQAKVNPVITAEQLLEHWQGHRRLTRRAIEVYPEDKFFTYSIGGMRPFADLIMEMLAMPEEGLKGAITGDWLKGEDVNKLFARKAPATKADILRLWDETTEKINELWPKIPAHRFQENDMAFGMYEGQIYWTILYFIDNEIHHRGQGYVYLRSLGIEPPAFWERN